MQHKQEVKKCKADVPTHDKDGTMKDSDYWFMCLKDRPCPVHDSINTIIEEEKKEFAEKIDTICKQADQYQINAGYPVDVPAKTIILSLLTTSIQRAYEAGRTDILAKIPMLRQWLNEDKITDVNRMVTNEQIRYWLIGEE